MSTALDRPCSGGRVDWLQACRGCFRANRAHQKRACDHDSGGQSQRDKGAAHSPFHHRQGLRARVRPPTPTRKKRASHLVLRQHRKRVQRSIEACRTAIARRQSAANDGLRLSSCTCLRHESRWRRSRFDCGSTGARGHQNPKPLWAGNWWHEGGTSLSNRGRAPHKADARHRTAQRPRHCAHQCPGTRANQGFHLPGFEL